MVRRVILFYILCTLPFAALAEDSLWKSEIELGVVMTSGNTEEENVNGKGDFTRDAEKWRHNLHLDTFRSSKDDEVTAEKFYVAYKIDYKFTDKRFLFTRLSYEDDRFGGFDYQVDLTLGYGQTFIDNDTMKLEADIGPGSRWSKLDNGDTETEGIVRIAGRFEWQFSETAQFTQALSSEIGQDATILRSVSALKTTITEKLAMKLSYSVKHNTEVPVGSEKTDTEMALTLGYSF
jgi:putative salt-induced outer membrane protein YdiY